jgi:tRNA U34 5-methylaminomethyl-2-thiouridine-forming methyltransferase MnmC
MGAVNDASLEAQLLELGAVRTDDGSFTLAGSGHGQNCHSTFGARSEARRRYADLCIDGPVEPLEVRGTAGRPLRLLDVGLGLGLNTTAAWERLVARRGPPAALEVLALELDPEIVARSLRLPPDGDPEFERHHGLVRSALGRALANGAPRWCGEVTQGFTLEIRFGDARRTLLEAPPTGPFDAVFLDPFSPDVDAPLWELGFLRAIADRMAPGAVLSTYCAATHVRVHLRAAGLEVGAGPRVGPKAEGTIAARGVRVPPLHPRVQRRIDRRAAELCSGGESARDPL